MLMPRMLNPDKSYNKYLTSIGLTFMQTKKKLKAYMK